jgi:hypothetical protein
MIQTPNRRNSLWSFQIEICDVENTSSPLAGEDLPC